MSTEPTTSDPSDKPAPQAPASDEAWKEQVRQENAALDRAQGGSEQPALPANFNSLVEMFSMQAMVALGLIPHPASNKPDRQLPLARHFIDLLGVIEQKSAGNLSGQEQALLGSTLHYLRMSYIDISRSAAPSEK